MGSDGGDDAWYPQKLQLVSEATGSSAKGNVRKRGQKGGQGEGDSEEQLGYKIWELSHLQSRSLGRCYWL